METLGSRLKKAMTARGVSAQDIANANVMSRANVYLWLNDTTNPSKSWDGTSRKLCKFLRINRDWLLHGRGPMDETDDPPPPPADPTADDWADVTGYAQAAGLGTGPEAAEWAETHKLKFRRDSLARKRLNPKHLAVMYGTGDSMEPTIRAGDAILFDTSDTTPRHRGIYVLLVPGAGAEEYVVKRALVSKGAVSFVSDNPDGDHDWKEPRPLADGLKVVGRVRWTGGWVK